MIPRAEPLERRIASLAVDRPRVVAFSGGVDSSVVLAAAAASAAGSAAGSTSELATETGGGGRPSVLAVTAMSPSVASWQLTMAKQIAREIGVQHQVVPTRETLRPDYIANDRRRCFYCKQTLYEAIGAVRAASTQVSGQPPIILSGTNAEDLGDHRPGIQAGREAGVQTPLADLGLGKSEVRRLARHYRLSNADLPASPCLASRIAYGTAVTPRRLRLVERAEQRLRNAGFDVCRVRLRVSGGLVHGSIEVDAQHIGRLRELDLAPEIRRLGFDRLIVDPEGFRSGKLNDAPESDLIQIASSSRPGRS